MKKTYTKHFNIKLQAKAYYNKVRQNEQIRFATCSFNVEKKTWEITYQFV